MGKASRVETKALASGNGNRFSPCWNEAWLIEGWRQEDALEFTIYDEGLIASGTEGRVMLPSDKIFPDGFSGMLPISGQEHAMLDVIVSVQEQPVLTYELTNDSVVTSVHSGSNRLEPCPWIFSCCHPGEQVAAKTTKPLGHATPRGTPTLLMLGRQMRATFTLMRLAKPWMNITFCAMLPLSG